MSHSVYVDHIIIDFQAATGCHPNLSAQAQTANLLFGEDE